MERILFIINIRALEDDICDKLTKDNFKHEVVGSFVDGRSILEKAHQLAPTLIIIREDDAFWVNKTEMLQTIYALLSSMDVRIIFLAKNREIGDKLLANLVTYGVKDIIRGTSVTLDSIVNSIKNPATLKDANIYLPRPGADMNDELLFEVKKQENKNEEQTKPRDMGININIPVSIGRKNNDSDLSEIDIDGEEDEEVSVDTKEAKPGSDKKKISLFDTFNRLAGQRKKTEGEPVIQNPTETQPTSPQPVPKPEPTPQPQSEPEPVKQPVPPPKLIQKESLVQETAFEPKQSQQSIMQHKPILQEVKTPNVAQLELEKMRRMLEEKEAEMKRMQSELLEKERAKESRFLRKNNGSETNKIITFYSSVGGVGTTLAAFSTATQLAQNKNKVLFIELDDKRPTLSYWYDIGLDKWGLDVCLSGFETKNYKYLEKSIITKEKLLDEQSDLSMINYKIMPNNLDYLFFSKDYLKLKNKSVINASTFNDLVLFLLHTYRYDYIIIDVSSNTDQSIVETTLIHSHKNIIVLNQDVSSVSYNLKFLTELENRGIVFNMGKDKENLVKSDKNIYLLNRFDKHVRFTPDILADWFRLKDSSNIIILPNNVEDVLNALYEARIPLNDTRDKYFKKAIEFLCHKIK